MAAITRQLDAAHALIVTRQLFYQLPGAIAAAVIDEEDLARRRDAPRAPQAMQQQSEPPRRLRQDFLFVEAGHDDREPRQRARGRGLRSALVCERLLDGKPLGDQWIAGFRDRLSEQRGHGRTSSHYLPAQPVGSSTE
jgi:hypothetical protein